MRILLLNLEKGWRGGERQTLLSMQQFREQGHEAVLLARKNDMLAQAARAQGFQVFEVGNIAALLTCLWKNRARFDIFHAQTANTLTWLAVLKPFLRGKLVFTRRTAFPVTKRQTLTAWKWRQADAFVAVIDAAASEPRRLGIPVHHIIPSAFPYVKENPQEVERLRAHFQTQGRFVIATAAALTPEKDPLTLVNAVHYLRQLRSDFVFLHFGKPGVMQAQVQARVDELQLHSHYKFAGFYSNISDCYRIMDVFVLSSSQEALGGSVLEAFLYRVPVVSTAAGGLKEVAGEGRGLICAVGDSQALAQGIHHLLAQPALCETMVNQAYCYVKNEYGVEQMGQRYLAAYAQALQA